MEKGEGKCFVFKGWKRLRLVQWRGRIDPTRERRDLQRQSPKEGRGVEWIQSPQGEWVFIESTDGSKEWESFVRLGNKEEVGPASHGAGGNVLKATSGSVDIHSGGGRKPWKVLREEQRGLISI